METTRGAYRVLDRKLRAKIPLGDLSVDRRITEI
jgi:hypothetical protein